MKLQEFILQARTYPPPFLRCQDPPRPKDDVIPPFQQSYPRQRLEELQAQSHDRAAVDRVAGTEPDQALRQRSEFQRESVQPQMGLGAEAIIQTRLQAARSLFRTGKRDTDM